jgi:hypothetical protein
MTPKGGRPDDPAYQSLILQSTYLESVIETESAFDDTGAATRHAAP